ncbi:hypothetical protein [Sulfuricella sp.]|uniref:hypothetical protein n=1 Tax=Sulfuricella sp. TaxID=2099377 RepID=UPI002D04F733|nr:hypothetical protein [Sulfuricella sp.]HUX62426.1 hypothetical protein [Sulfuricella sp.]
MKSKFAWTLTVAFVGLAALSAKSAYSDGLSCSDWSFNTSGCSAHIEKTSQAPASATAQGNKQQLASCSDWSFNTPGCSANIERTNSAPASVAAQANKQQLACSDWSFNTPGCSAHIN